MFEDLKPHIQDLRKRLIISCLAVVVSFGVCFGFWKELFNIVQAPIKAALESGVKGKLMQLTPLEGIFSAMSISFLTAFIIATPIVFWQLWLFVAPGLYKNEKKIVLPFVFFGTSMFIAGAMFAYYVALPIMIKFILHFGNEMFEADISIQSYVGFFVRVVLGFGVCFELPVLGYFLARVGLITDETLKRFFKYAVVIIFIIAAIITPPDPFSQLLMAFPLIALYGLSILIAYFVNPANKLNNDDSIESNTTASNPNTNDSNTINSANQSNSKQSGK